MFSIYYAAVTSLSQEECIRLFRVDRDRLLAHYKHGTEAALTNADFLNSMDLVTLQAFVIFLVRKVPWVDLSTSDRRRCSVVQMMSICFYDWDITADCAFQMCLRSHSESRTVWTLTSLAIRIGHALDLHRDRSGVPLSCYEVEMRRRLWWQINVLDIRASEDRGSSPMIFEHSTKMPSNLNDQDINLQSEKVLERVGGTEMTFSLITQELSDLARRLSYVPPSIKGDREALHALRLEKENMVKECSQRLESKYVSHCDTSVPIFYCCSMVARLAILKMSLLVQYPYEPQHMAARTEASKERVLKTALTILELSEMGESNESTAKWIWFFATYVQWHPLAVILAELCSRTSGPEVERAWAIVDLVFDKWSNRVADTKSGPLWRPIKKLYGKARSARLQNRERAEGNTGLLPDVQYVPTPTMSQAYTAPGNSESLNILGSPPAVVVGTSGLNEGQLPYLQQQMGMEANMPTDAIFDMNFEHPIDPVNWGEWDAFIESTWNTGDPAQELGSTFWTTQFRF